MCGRVRPILKNVLVEPLLFFFMLSFEVFRSASFPAFYLKICQNIVSYKRPELCDTLNFNGTLENFVQKEASNWLSYQEMLKFLPTFMATMFFGCFADRFGRKVPMVLAVASMCIYQGLYLSFSTLSKFPVYSILLLEFGMSIVPFQAICIMSTHSYLADVVVDEESLTTRYAILTAFWSLAAVLGEYVASILLKLLNYDQVMVIGQALSIIPFLATLYFFPRQHMVSECPDSDRSFILEAFHLLKTAFRTLVKPRPNHGRAHLILLCLIVIVYGSEDTGVDMILSMYTFHNPLNWSPYQLSQYYSIMSLVQLVGSLIGVYLMKKFHFEDTTIICVGIISASLKMGFIALVGLTSGETWVMFAGLIFGVLSTAGFPALRAFVARLGHKEEAGELLGAVTVFTGLISLFSAAVYNNIYAATVSVYPGICFGFASLLLILCACVVFGIHIDRKSASGADQQLELNGLDCRVPDCF